MRELELELELELRDLGAALDLPETPDVVAAVRPRLRERVSTRRRRWPVVAFAAALVAILVGLAVSPARSTILHFFGIGAVRIEYVDRLPGVQVAPTFDPATRIDESKVPFPILRSDLLGQPDGVYSELGIVTLLYGTPQQARLIVTEIRGTALPPETVKKLLTSSTDVRAVAVAGADEPALWIEGVPHVVFLPGAPGRLAANTLVWRTRGLTLRLEGAASREQAIRIAESFR